MIIESRGGVGTDVFQWFFTCRLDLNSRFRIGLESESRVFMTG